MAFVARILDELGEDLPILATIQLVLNAVMFWIAPSKDPFNICVYVVFNVFASARPMILRFYGRKCRTAAALYRDRVPNAEKTRSMLWLIITGVWYSGTATRIGFPATDCKWFLAAYKLHLFADDFIASWILAFNLALVCAACVDLYDIHGTLQIPKWNVQDICGHDCTGKVLRDLLMLLLFSAIFGVLHPIPRDIKDLMTNVVAAVQAILIVLRNNLHKPLIMPESNEHLALDHEEAQEVQEFQVHFDR